ncbi:heme NO-binding domain-containing protein [Photobacterium damselae]|uniref:heme NO-binding domain-containing protein n=1 Tax=Photobacterium damselae TaxID=38293 RepID=UPI00083A7164|nr:heme NO-binding domain-containing protein [Photobacterium damselae]KAB1511608.1 guanylate cyclase [Photobacterium damselae subsp. damselae]NVH49020.1 heme NO-binding domain-containing protein [Photobacterium damselae subsp. damselae]PSB79668.1 guanylate cyclase [Photobacterium damselae subsp. damselae]PSB90117.1 guanylate cyclase [Photobacterium damselae subsp. damselae]QSH58910.1 heme NO-binding domain-containing protein [Photobacterium damselae subsp. damselae]
MKGIIFTEFIDIVEDQFGLAICQQMLDEAKDEGIYTAVGSYEHTSLVKLILALSKITKISAAELQESFGYLVFPRLLTSLPIQITGDDSTFSFIQRVENHIHTEVKKLYPDATPPRFEFISSTQTYLIFDYHSARCMSHVCLGLIKGCAQYFNQTIEITMTPLNSTQSHVHFELCVS